MTEPSTIHDTFVLEREYPAPPARVFAAFSDSKKKRTWFIDSGKNEVEHYELNFRAGGKETARFRFKPGSPVSGMLCETETTYIDIVPDQRMVFANSMAIGGKHISAALVTVELLPAQSGTTLVLTHQGAFFPGADGPKMRKGGWEFLMDQLGIELAG
jgi:uncharacterized protein YndB with AHSA1/START domain